MAAVVQRVAPVLEFDEPTHTYRVGGQVVPNVTSIIAPYSGYAGFDTAAMETARQKGQHVHRMIELDVAGTLDEKTLPDWMKPVLSEWRAFVHDTGFSMILSEHRMYHATFRYAGTLDLYGCGGQGDGQSMLIDIKRSFLAGPAIGLQTAAYLEALRAERSSVGTRPVKRFALKLREDSRYRMIELTDPLDRTDFLAALALHNRGKRYAR